MEGTSLSEAVEALSLVALAQARAEFLTCVEMLRFDDAERARIDASDASSMVKLVERSAIALEIGQAMGLSEGQVGHRLAAVRRVRTHTPHVWLAFSHGRIDLARVREISSTVDALERPASIDRLDETVVTYATPTPSPSCAPG